MQNKIGIRQLQGWLAFKSFWKDTEPVNKNKWRVGYVRVREILNQDETEELGKLKICYPNAAPKEKKAIEKNFELALKKVEDRIPDFGFAELRIEQLQALLEENRKNFEAKKFAEVN